MTIPKRRVRAKATNKPYKKGMGYGFAQFTSTEDASKALAELTDATWNDRKLTVSFAKPNQVKQDDEANDDEETSALEGDGAAAAPKKSKRNRRSKKENSAESGDAVSNGTSAAGTEASESGKPRGRRPPLPLNEESPTTDTVFVAGIPRAATVADIKEFFAAEEPVSVKISQQNVYNRKDKTRERVNRGFALVKFADEATRDAVIQKYHEQEWDGRVIHLRIALDVLQTEGETEAQEESKEESKKEPKEEVEEEPKEEVEEETKEAPKEEAPEEEVKEEEAEVKIPATSEETPKDE